MDFKSISIDQSKISADGDAYFALFDKHIPRNLGNGSTVLLYELANMTCIMKIIALNPDAKYIVIGNEFVNDALKLMVDKHVDVEYKDKIDLKECSMKFDCIVMNPPYCKNLHLKILAEAIKHLKNDESVCVNLSPVRWLQDPLAKYKKISDLKRFEESVAKHIESLDIINAFDAQTLFNGAGAATALGVYICSINTYPLKNYIPSFVVKTLNTQNTHPIFDSNKKNGYRVKLPIMFTCNAGHTDGTNLEGIGPVRWFLNGLKDNKPWFEFYQRNQFSKLTDYIPCSIEFNSQIEAENFCKQYDTIFCKVYTHYIKRDVNISPLTILWMNDFINPRTGLKGYKGEWTNEDFYKFFNITPEEQKTIEETMAKYK